MSVTLSNNLVNNPMEGCRYTPHLFPFSFLPSCPNHVTRFSKGAMSRSQLGESAVLSPLPVKITARPLPLGQPRRHTVCSTIKDMMGVPTALGDPAVLAPGAGHDTTSVTSDAAFDRVLSSSADIAACVSSSLSIERHWKIVGILDKSGCQRFVAIHDQIPGAIAVVT
jgi:hypothetical protein